MLYHLLNILSMQYLSRLFTVMVGVMSESLIAFLPELSTVQQKHLLVSLKGTIKSNK